MSRSDSVSQSSIGALPVAPISPPPPDFFVAGKEFHLKEYESLRKEVGELVEHSRKLEIYAVGGVAAFYAWYLHDTNRPATVTLLVPIFLVVIAAFRSWSVLTRIFEIAAYIRGLEQVLALKELRLVGWETHRAPAHKTPSPFRSSAAIFWGVMLGVCLLAMLLLPHWSGVASTPLG